MSLQKLLIAVPFIFGASAFAATSSDSSQKTNESKMKIEKKSEKEDLDKEITNAKMRAESGSKSKVSASFRLSYSGGPLSNPFGRERPKLDSTSNQAPLTKLSGDISGRYRINKNISMRAGTGIQMISPFHDSLENSDVARENTTASDPFLGLAASFKAAGLQQSLSATIYQMTNKGDSEAGELNEFWVSHTMLKSLKDVPLSLGLSTSIGFYHWKNDAKAKNANRFVGFYPFAEYAFNDRYSFRTVFRASSMIELRSTQGWFHIASSQSVGLGIAATRDIYVYPNFQFNYDQAQLDKSNFGVSTTINAF